MPKPNKGLMCQIALETGEDVAQAKVEWKALRDAYLRKKKLLRARLREEQEEAACVSSRRLTSTNFMTWPYFAMLAFLDPFLEDDDDDSSTGNGKPFVKRNKTSKARRLTSEGNFGWDWEGWWKR